MFENRELVDRFQDQADELKGLEKELFYKQLLGSILIDISVNKEQGVTDNHIFNIERAFESAKRISEGWKRNNGKS